MRRRRRRPTPRSRRGDLRVHADRPATFECALDAAPFAPCASPATFAPLSEAKHSFKVRALAGSVADPTPAGTSWRVDLTPPDTEITGAPPADVASSASFAFAASSSTRPRRARPGSSTWCRRRPPS